MRETEPSSSFNLADKPKNLKIIKEHFDTLNLYSFFDVRILQQETELTIDTITHGIVAGFAVWSGYSFSNSSYILNQIKDLCKPKISLIVMDTDYFSVNFQKKLFGTAMHGYFDCCLIENGIITAQHKSQPEIAPFINAVKKSRPK